MDTVIRFQGVRKIFGKEQEAALANIDIEVKKGEFVCLIGPSGCGKTTVLNLIAGLEKQDAGTIQCPGGVSMVFQSSALFPWLTVAENVAVGLRASGAKEKSIPREVGKYLEMMRLDGKGSLYPNELSGGGRQRVGIARALAANPEVLLLDEPFSALDPKITAELHDDLLAIWKKTGMTIVMVSHLIEEAILLADRVILMKEGAIESEFEVKMPYPRHEQGANFTELMLRIRKAFFR